MLVRIAVAPPRGLHADYFPGDRAGGTPAIAVTDPDVSTNQIIRDWRGVEPSVFSVRWYGFIAVWRAGHYTFETMSDDGSTLTIDRTLVVDNGGRHPATAVTGTVALRRGVHAVFLGFTQYGGQHQMTWRMAAPGGSLRPVPTWTLSPTRMALWKVVAGRVCDVMAIALMLIGGVLALMLVSLRRTSLVAYPRAAALVVFVVLAVIHTWPLATDLGHLTRNDNRDAMLNEWIVAWVAHQAPRAPLHLFDANIFFPERNTLAYSEAMIVQSAMGAPLLWAGASPVLTYNVLLLAGFALTGWTMWVLIRQWTADAIAAYVAGFLFAFNAHSLTRLPHLQALHVEFLPLAFLALDRLLRVPSVPTAIQVAGWVILQSLTSVYMLVLTMIAVAAALLARANEWIGVRFKTAAIPLAAMVVAGLCALVPFLLPYWHVSRDQGLSRTLIDAAQYSASWKDYLSTPARLHFGAWSYRFSEGTALFPGVLALILACVAMGRGLTWSDSRARMCLAAGIAGVALSFGPAMPGYSTLYAVIPLLRGVRATARFGHLAIFAAVALAGFGVASVRRAISPFTWQWLAPALLLAAAFESCAAPIGYARFDGIAPIYARVPAEPGTVVAEFPFFGPRSAQFHAWYMLNSTAHWQPVVNGYSGFQPASFYRNAEPLQTFPDEPALARLRDLGVTHVIVHTEQFPPDVAKRVEALPGFQKVDVFGSIALYRINQ